jgi:hypothetical protein
MYVDDAIMLVIFYDNAEPPKELTVTGLHQSFHVTS